jgi:hypothetical protein
MPDWCKFVRQRLADLPLHPAEMEEVRAEIAAHLEDTHQALLTQGLSKTEALERTRSQVANWPELQRQILIAKNGAPTMSQRLQQLWIPGLLSFALSTAILEVLQHYALLGYVVNRIGISILWLLTLPCLGALAAWLPARAGGSRRTVLLASMFPVLAMAFGFASMFPIGFLLQRFIGRPVSFPGVASFFLTAPIGSLLVPAIALLAGAMLVRALASQASSPREKSVS